MNVPHITHIASLRSARESVSYMYPIYYINYEYNFSLRKLELFNIIYI